MLWSNKIKTIASKANFSLIQFKNGLKNDNLIRISSARSFTKEASLPKLPVPSLEMSITKYLTALKPILTPEEFATSQKSQKVATDFIRKDGIGEKLQKFLVQKSNTTDNWLAQWWLDKTYLEPRYSVMINVNPASLYPKADYRTINDQIIFATRYISGFLEFKKFLEENRLPVEKLGQSSLCMDQYYKLFGTCRIPNPVRDLIKVFEAGKIDHKITNHITVMYNNKIFNLQIIDPNTGVALSSSEIYSNLTKLIETESGSKPEIGLGLLTAENRDIWYRAYEELSQNEQNKRNLESIQNSFFVLCLDTKESASSNRSYDSAQILHGNKEFTSNRWFDKTIQIIVGPDGVWGSNFEHSIAEAVPHSYMNDFIYKFMLNDKSEIHSNSNNNRIEHLDFKISANVQEQLIKSRDTLNKFIDDLEVHIQTFDKFGKNFPKSQKISPDAFVQLVMQLAFYRTHNFCGNTYESGSLRKFHLGRTDVIRSCTLEAGDFVKSMNSFSPNSSQNKERLALFQRALNSHRLFTGGVVNCESFDRHLLGLKLLALENNLPLPELYNDTGYKKACHYYLSTSQVSSKFEAVTSYGPAVNDGYGACYNITEKKILFGLSAHNSCPTTSAEKLGSQIVNSLIDCQSLLESTKSN